MITFDNWILQNNGSLIARQYDNMSQSLVILGDIPDGYTWDLLVENLGNLNIIQLSPMDGGIGVVLTADMVALSGNYIVQLRGTLQSDGITVRHTNKISVFIPSSLSGNVQWPTIPSEFTQMEQRIQELNNHPPVPGGNGMWMLWNPDTNEYEESDIPLPDGGGYAIGNGLKIVDGKLTVDTADKVEKDNTKPITSAAVYTTVGNIDALLKTI